MFEDLATTPSDIMVHDEMYQPLPYSRVKSWVGGLNMRLLSVCYMQSNNICPALFPCVQWDNDVEIVDLLCVISFVHSGPYIGYLYQWWWWSLHCWTVLQLHLHCHTGEYNRSPDCWMVRSQQQPTTEQQWYHCGKIASKQLSLYHNPTLHYPTYIPWWRVQLPGYLGYL